MMSLIASQRKGEKEKKRRGRRGEDSPSPSSSKCKALLNQLLNIPPRRRNSLHRRLTQPSPPLHRLLLPPRLSLTTPTRRHARHQHPSITRREVHKPDFHLRSASTCSSTNTHIP